MNTMEARAVRQALAAYQRAEDLILLGAYVSGSRPQANRSIQLWPEDPQFLAESAVGTSIDAMLPGLARLAENLG